MVKEEKNVKVKGTDKLEQEPFRSYYWKKGQSGNPKGRPANVKFLSEILKAQLLESADLCKETRVLALKLGLNARASTIGGVLVLSMIVQACKGDGTIAKEIFNRIEGALKYAFTIDPIDGAGLSETDLRAAAQKILETKND
jgi:hypothetical protein